MYQNPVLFPEQTNREDLLRTVSLFDDDTNEAIDVSGRVLAAPGDFTLNNWTVIVGDIVTASVTQFTIPDYPIGSELQALAIVVGQGLAILPGAFVTIADAPTQKNTVFGYVTSYAPATGAMVVQSGSAFEFEIRGSNRSDDFGTGYGSSSQIGCDDFTQPIISAQLGNGLTVVDIGRVEIRIPEAIIAQLRHRTYGIAMSMFDGADTRQLFIGKLPILNGGVRSMPLSTPSTSNPFGLP